MAVKTKIVEATASELTKKVVALLLPLLSGLVLAIVPPVRDRILPGLPKPLLAVLVGLSLSLNLALFLYVRRLRSLLNQKLLPRFGVLWSSEHVPHCPACSKVLTYIYERDGFFGTWGFKCAQCSTFIPLNDDDGRSIEIADAKRLLSGGKIETPELDETSMQILTLLAEQNSKLTAEDLAAILGLHPQRMNHYLTNLSRQKYIFASTSWAVPSGPTTYHLNDKGRELLMSKNLI